MGKSRLAGGDARHRVARVRTQTVFVSIAALTVMPAASLAQNLVQNPGFETGTGCGFGCTGALFWTYTGAAFTNPVSLLAHTGTNALALALEPGAFGPNGTGPGTASQSVSVSRPGTYTFSFWEAVYGTATYNLTAAIGSRTTFSGTVTGLGSPPTYVQQSTNVVLSAGANTIQFSGAYVSGSGPATLIDDVSLTLLSPTLLSAFLPAGAPVNVVNAAGAIDSFSNNGGTPPAGFLNLYALPPSQLQAALTQLDGEAATGAERGAFQLTTEFLGLMLDPFVDGRFGGLAGGGAGAIGFAPDEQASLPPDVALAYASVLKAPPRSFDQRWTAWGTAYGGSNSANGDAAVGSTDIGARTFGFAAGMDYRVTPDTVVGFALAGGGTNWGLADGLGTGRSDAFQAGVYGITRRGPAYLGGAFAFANHWFATSRAALGDQLSADFSGQSYGGRLEGGYRYAVLPTLGVTPYAALQAQDFHTPAYSETDVTGGGFGLSYAAMDATDIRTELGARLDAPTLLGGMPLVLRGRLAWAHDVVSNPALSAAFEALPGGSFTVNGAPIPHDSALASAGAELLIAPRWTLLAKFDGEFAAGSQTYAGTGTLRYHW
jgi:Autotransporter beta-domain